MNRNKVLVSLIVVLLITNLAVLYYYTKYLPNQRKNASRSEWAIKTMQLDSAQAKEYRLLRQIRDSALDNHNLDYRNVRLKTIDLMHLEQPSDSAISALADSIIISQKPIEVEMLRHYFRIKKILRPDQYQYLDSSIYKMVMFNTSFKKPNGK